MSYDPATVRAMLVEAAMDGASDADRDGNCAHDDIASRILAAHPAPSTPAPSELHEHCVRMATEAWEQSYALFGAYDDRARAREHFLAAVRERLAQSAQVAACNLATNKDAAELLSAAEWLDKTERGWDLVSAEPGVDWSAPRDFGRKVGRAPSLHLAILAAARSLGWPGVDR